MPWILVVEDTARSYRLPIADGECIAGNGDDVDLVLDHPTVSRRHARLRPGTNGILLTDLGSSNGTQVDGARVLSETLVAAGQKVHFGSMECRLEATDVAEMEPAMEFTAAAGESPTARGDGAGTLSVGSVRNFVLSDLPRLVDRLEDHLAAVSEALAHRGSGAAERSPSRTRLALVQAAGQALFASFPCRELTIVERAVGSGRNEAVLFQAGARAGTETEGEADSAAGRAESEREDWTRSTAGGLETRIRFTPGLHTAGIVPLVDLVTRLIAMEVAGDRPGSSLAPPADPRPRPDRPVELPRPATVDPVVRKIYEDARRIARGDVGVLIAGESGTGKEVLAKFVHACSPRAERPWTALNCAALPQDLLEAELFGIEKGVATGVEARPGKFEQAHDGTLFLDEIGDMSPATQAKILRVLQEGEVYRLGGRVPRPARVRVIAATNRDLTEMIDSGGFRLDLYHRIADCRFTLPPLRERLGDLPNLAAHFLVRAASQQGVAVRGISKAALSALLGFAWPGNVRQLEREMARAALFLEDGELLQSRHLHSDVMNGTGHFASGTGEEGLKARLERVERGMILETLIRHDRNVRQAAKELGLGRTTLYRRLQELGIDK